MAKDGNITIRIEKELQNKLDELARKENRTLSNFVRNIVYKFLKEKK